MEWDSTQQGYQISGYIDTSEQIQKDIQIKKCLAQLQSMAGEQTNKKVPERSIFTLFQNSKTRLVSLSFESGPLVRQVV